MTLQEVWKIKEQKSQQTKNMTTAQLNEYFAENLKEFCTITGKQITNNEYGFILGSEYYKKLAREGN